MNHHVTSILSIIIIFFLANCERKDEHPVSTTDAQIVAFHSEKLYCWWGWEIKIGSEIIRADSIPDLKPWTDKAFPLNGKITLGSKTRTCSSGIDYYEIREFIPEK